MCKGTGQQPVILPASWGISLRLLLRQEFVFGVRENLGIELPLCPQGLAATAPMKSLDFGWGESTLLDTWCSEVAVQH